jgi:hypothetical protein
VAGSSSETASRGGGIFRPSLGNCFLRPPNKARLGLRTPGQAAPRQFLRLDTCPGAPGCEELRAEGLSSRGRPDSLVAHPAQTLAVNLSGSDPPVAAASTSIAGEALAVPTFKSRAGFPVMQTASRPGTCSTTASCQRSLRAQS